MKRKRVEPGIYRQVNGQYAVYLLVNGKPRYKTIGPKLSEARRQRMLLRAQADQGQLPTPTRLSFAQLAETWIEGVAAQVVAGERSERTLENYRYHLDKHLLPTLGRKRIQEISTDDAARLIAQLRSQGLAPKTIAGALVPLGRILALALRRGHINDNPLRRLDQSERPRPQKRDQRVLDHDQISRLLQHTLPGYRPIISTALYTGMRLNELLGLTWGDVDFDHGLVHVRHQLSRPRLDSPARRVQLKTRAAARDIPLLPQLASLLRHHKMATHHSQPSDYVFATSRGTANGYRNIERRGLGHAADSAGLNSEDQPRLRLHDLRHTFASHLIIDLKLDIAHVSHILGHARPSITLDTYTHLFNHANHTNNIRTQMANSTFAALLS